MPLSDEEREVGRAYLEGGGACCPYCESEELETDRLDADGPLPRGRVTCLDCRRTWVDIYELAAVELHDEAGAPLGEVWEGDEEHCDECGADIADKEFMGPHHEEHCSCYLDETED